MCVVLFIGDHLINTLDIVGTLRKFRDIPTVEIGLLEEDSAIQLITKPVENLFEYEEEAIKTIFSLSAGHPYIIQIICFAIFSKVRQNNSFAVKVTATDVKAVLDQAMEIGEAGLSSFWYGFSVFERIVLSAVAQGKETGVNYLDLLASYQIDPENSLIRSATKQLFATGFFDNTGNIQIELMRRWIVRRYPLADEINLLREFQESENLRDVELKFNPESDEFGDNIINNIIGDDNTINDNNTVSDDNRISKFLPSSRSQSNLMIISAIINTLVLIILSVILASFYRLMTPSRSDQNIFRDRIFPNTKNRDRNFNLAIETLEKADYQRAVELFEKAMQDNPRDPEVLILYNNALANQQGSPLAKLAVVLPVTGVRFTDNIQQEILRGVAQAQDEFNQKRRKQNKNARLVEILVCNKKTTAEQVAKELVDEPSISGVIDYDAHDREFTIPIYEKSELAVIFSPVADATSKIPSFFKAASSDISVNSAQKLAEYAHNNLQAKTAVIFANPQNGYGKKMIEEFRNRFKTLGGEVTKVVDFTGPNFDAMEAVNELQSPIAVLFPDRENVSPAVNIAKARSDSSDKQVRGLKLLTGDTLYGDNIPAENIRAMEGMVFSIPGFSNNNMIQGQKASQTAETSYMATSYNATQLLIESLSPNAERGIIRNKLLKKQKIILVELKNGKFVPIKVSK
ncbi:MAG: ABC transporter substrate-binding protein [Cylindrospermopsis raciborskii]|uniref:ABC transporter substrate-binding protein n=1 Tax=Cylindrospermopsis raciborskii TaxID=77022 RepID=UPI003D0DA6D7